MKSGFTLVELLAVIVILAILSIVATPIVLDLIEESKNSASLVSANFYFEAVKLSLTTAEANNKVIPNGTYDIMKNGNICLEYKEDKCVDELNVKINKNYPKTGTIVIKEKNVDSITIELNNRKMERNGTEGFTFVEEKIYETGTVIYFNVSNGKSCKEKEFSNENIKEGCMKFYVLKDLGNSLDLILDHNTTSKIVWINNSDYLLAGGSQTDWDNKYCNLKGPITLLKQLYNDTKDWVGTEIPSNYIMDQRGQKSNAYYTIEYNKVPNNIEGATEPYKARIISAQEIAEITGKTNWDEKNTSVWYYFSTLRAETISSECTDKDPNTICKYNWLYDKTKNCTDYGCNVSDSLSDGYWTVSSQSNSSNYAWHIRSTAQIRSYISTNLLYGVRPVITVLKSKLT